MFPGWSMGFRPEYELPPEYQSEIATLFAITRQDGAPRDHARAMRLMKNFVDLMR